MSLYFVVFHDGAFQYIEGYKCKWVGVGHVAIDKGHGEQADFFGVDYVQDKGLIA